MCKAQDKKHIILVEKVTKNDDEVKILGWKLKLWDKVKIIRKQKKLKKNNNIVIQGQNFQMKIIIVRD